MHFASWILLQRQELLVLYQVRVMKQALLSSFFGGGASVFHCGYDANSGIFVCGIREWKDLAGLIPAGAGE